MYLFALDPGPVESHYVVWDVDTNRLLFYATDPNNTLIYKMDTSTTWSWWTRYKPSKLIIEDINASYSHKVGNDVFNTAKWIGRFMQQWQVYHDPNMDNICLVSRSTIRAHILGSMKGSGPAIRKVLAKRIGMNHNPCALNIHQWQALALAIWYYDVHICGQGG